MRTLGQVLAYSVALLGVALIVLGMAIIEGCAKLIGEEETPALSWMRDRFNGFRP